MRVRIYRPAKTASQSGRALIKTWVLEYEQSTARKPEPLMGWTSSGDTLGQVRLKFQTADQAIDFAKTKGWDVDIETPRDRTPPRHSYMDNFNARPSPIAKTLTPKTDKKSDT